MLLALALASCGIAADETASQIERLAAPRAEERAEAQRWLSAHLSAEAFPLVAAAFAGGEAEVRERLIEALASDDRHLELAALAATDTRDAVRTGGRAAIEELVARWNPATLGLPAAARVLPDEWLEEGTRPLALTLGARSLADHLDQLVRLGGGPATIVLDPSLDPAVFARLPDERVARSRSIGTWAKELQAIAAAWRVSFEVHGRRADAPRGSADDDLAWVLVCKRGSEGDTRGAAHIVAWCEGVLRELDPRGNAACARALGALGWPAGLQWLERRWSARADAAALEGLLVAASRGWVVPGLADPSALRSLLADLDRRLAVAEPGSFARAERTAAALYALGPSTSAGESVAEILLEGWEALGPASRWVRLVGLEGTRGRTDRGRDDCVALLASAASPALRAQALRSLAALSGPRGTVPAIPDAMGLLAWARDRGRLDAVIRSLTDLHAPYSAGAAAAGASSTELSLACLDWAAHAGKLEAALSHAERLLGDETALDLTGQRLRDWVELGEEDIAENLRAAIRAAAPGRFEPGSVERLSLRAGRFEAAAAAGALERLAGLPQPSAADARDLGELCAHPDLGWKAREALLAWIRPDVPADVLGAGLARGLQALRRARADFEAEALERRARELSVRSSHPLAETLLAAGWPPLPPTEPEDLDVQDHTLEL